MSIAELYILFRQSTGVCTDTRQIGAGNIFFALKGDHFDGNQFAIKALEAGARYAVVDASAAVLDERFILVNDVLSCLQDLATYHRQQFDIPLIAITGSNGKTTTKELVSAVMESHYPVHYTKGNFNNHIGVPLTLLAMPLTTEVAVIEMGANHRGEIAMLCRIARPTHGLITNIGKAHLEGFGGLEGVKAGKGELFDYLSQYNGMAFINKEEPFLSEMAQDVKIKLFYKQEDQPGLFAFQLLDDSHFLQVAFKDYDHRETVVESQLVGTYNFYNIMTAIAIGVYFKVPAKRIKQAIEAYVPQNNRSQLMQWEGHTILLDAYNANPTSMEHALQSFSKRKEARKMAILGDMLELGPTSEEEHLRIATLAKEITPQLVLVGKAFALPAKKLDLTHFENVMALRARFMEQTFDDHLILVKASRGIGLERLFKQNV